MAGGDADLSAREKYNKTINTRTGNQGTWGTETWAIYRHPQQGTTRETQGLYIQEAKGTIRLINTENYKHGTRNRKNNKS